MRIRFTQTQVGFIDIPEHWEVTVVGFIRDQNWIALNALVSDLDSGGAADIVSTALVGAEVVTRESQIAGLRKAGFFDPPVKS